LTAKKIGLINFTESAFTGGSKQALKMADQNRENWILGCCSWGFLLVGAHLSKKGGTKHAVEKNNRLALGLGESV
jgi:hypothetical protein